MKLGRNLLAGAANSVWTAIVGLIVVPLYLKYLGIETYGLIGFYTTTQVLLSLLDLGLAPTINREVARSSASGEFREARNLLHTLAVVYWVTAGIIALVISALAPVIASHWLQSSHITPVTLMRAVMLMGLVIACRWPIGLYQGAVIGMQRLTVSSTVNIVMVTCGNFGAVAILAYVSPTIEAFFMWQAGVALLGAAAMRWAAWRAIGRADTGRFDANGLKRIWPFSAGMSGVAVSGIILMQLDKVLLSRILSLEDFGRYALASLVANGLYVLLTPVFNAIYPRMSALVATGDTVRLIDFYETGTRLCLALLLPAAVTVAIFSKDLLYLWTRNGHLAAGSAPIVSLFVIGTALNGVMHFPYALQLAYGATRLPLTINMILMVIMVPLTITLAKSYGAVGGAAAWALLNALYLFVGTWLTHRSLLKGIGAKWLLSDVGLPLAITVIVAGAGGGLVHRFGYPYYINLLSGVGWVCMTFLLTVLVSPRLRLIVRNLRVLGVKANTLG
jgi:O-antigen/teichoic acid export membrane protein